MQKWRKLSKNEHRTEWRFGYAVFSTVGKGGVGIRGAYGKGQVYRGGEVTGTTKLFKATIGFQLGGQKFSFKPK